MYVQKEVVGQPQGILLYQIRFQSSMHWKNVFFIRYRVLSARAKSWERK